MSRLPRPIRIEGDVAYVPLTKGYEAVIDAADVRLVEGRNWCASVMGRSIYAHNTLYTRVKPQKFIMHRVIIGATSSQIVDHIDGNGLNNMRSNLRTATHAENLRNQRTSTRNTSGIKGVIWDKQRGKWKAQITLSGKKHYLGLFENMDDAAQAYARGSASLHQAFGRLA